MLTEKCSFEQYQKKHIIKFFLELTFRRRNICLQAIDVYMRLAFYQQAVFLGLNVVKYSIHIRYTYIQKSLLYLLIVYVAELLVRPCCLYLCFPKLKDKKQAGGSICTKGRYCALNACTAEVLACLLFQSRVLEYVIIQ